MDYFMKFHWWYLPVGFVLVFMFFGKGKGGIVVKRVTANLEPLDQRFAECTTEAKYSTFKEGSPDHIEIKIKELPVSAGDQLEFLINNKTLAMVQVKSKKKAEFDYWRDENVDFPVIKEGDELLIKSQGADVFKGTFF
jgi:hypothetical protein